MTDNIIKIVLYYYLGGWLVNVTAYYLVGFGLYRWLKFLRGVPIESIARTSFHIVVSFGTARLVVGLVGFSMYEADKFSALTTILVLGMTSLLLNTSFIMLEGYAVNKEANAVWSLPIADQEQVRRYYQMLDGLKRRVDA